MAAKRKDWLFATEWVHLREEDTADGAVFVRADADIPLSRQPRERVQLAPDGSARVSRPGADDRPVPRAASWQKTGDSIVVRTADGTGELEIVQASPKRLVVRSRNK